MAAWTRAEPQLASLFDVGVGQVREGEAGDTGRRYGKAGVVGRAAPAGLRRAPCHWRRGGKASGRGRGRGLRRGGGEVVVPLKPAACGDKGGVSALKDGRRRRPVGGFTFFVCGAFGVGEAAQAAGGGRRAAELWSWTTGAVGMVAQLLGGGLLNQRVEILTSAPKASWEF